MSSQETWLLDYIRRAFRGVTLGEGVSLHYGEYLDSYRGDEQELALSQLDESDDWSKVRYDEMTRCYSAFTFMDAEGFRFYTAPCMSFMIEQPAAETNAHDWFLYNLKVERDGTLKQVPFNSLYSEQQKAAIIRLLKYALNNQAKYFDSAEARRRLEEIKTRT